MTSQFETLEALEAIDWSIMRAQYWRDTDEDGDRKRRRQAEFLVHEGVPFSAVRQIGVMNEEAAQLALSALSGLADPPPVFVRPGWYY